MFVNNRHHLSFFLPSFRRRYLDVISFRDNSVYILEILQAKYFLDASSRQQAAAGAGMAQEVISGGNSNEKQQLYECNDLRKKGLCLVPLSTVINYLG